MKVNSFYPEPNLIHKKQYLLFISKTVLTTLILSVVVYFAINPFFNQFNSKHLHQLKLIEQILHKNIQIKEQANQFSLSKKVAYSFQLNQELIKINKEYSKYKEILAHFLNYKQPSFKIFKIEVNKQTLILEYSIDQKNVKSFFQFIENQKSIEKAQITSVSNAYINNKLIILYSLKALIK